MPNFNRASRWFRRLVGKGANRDVRPELLPDGLYADGLNIRPASTDGNSGGIEAIGGEELRYPANDGYAEGYVLIGSAPVNGKIVEFWAHPDPANFPIIRIDGVVVAFSEAIPYIYDRPLQIAVSERCRGGVLYPADHRSTPLFWDVDALLNELAAGADTYFAAYNIEINSVVLSAYPEFPRHIANLGLGDGLPAGQYSYMLRYESPTGDKTNFGPETPLISIGRVHDLTWTDTAFPGSRTTGGVADITTGTLYHAQLEWNIDNTQGFSYVEVVRRRFNEGVIDGNGTLEVIARIELIDGEFRNIKFLDPFDSNFLEVIPTNIALDQQIDVIAPKTVEYADNRLTYGNFMTANLDPGFTFRLNSDGQALVPITGEVITTEVGNVRNSGYTDPKNHTYKKSLVRGELYGLAIQGWDSKLGKPYAVPIPGTEDGGYLLPNRRDPKRGDSDLYSDARIYAANTDCQSGDPVTPTFDAFTQGVLRKRTDGFINVLNSLDGGITQAGYAPFSPVGPNDPNHDGYNLSPNISVYSGGTGAVSITGNIWNPRYNALGVLVYGVEDIPSNIRAFTVGRTEPAGRVVCQGLACYFLEESQGGQPATKSTTTVNFHSRDLLTGVVPQNIMEDVQNNPDNYELQFVAPLGFFTEWYSADRFPGTTDTQGAAVDMISYAGIQHDEGQVNVGEPEAYLEQMGYPSTGSAPPGNYVGYSSWRQGRPPINQSGVPAGSDSSYWNSTPAGDQPRNGNTPLGIERIVSVDDGRGERWIIETGSVYSPDTFSTYGSLQFGSDATRAFHQPWYVVNIVRKGAVVPQGTGQYVNTGTTIKVEGCIGVSGGEASQIYRLVNERWEDVLGYLDTDFRYTYISQRGQPVRAWLCITNNNQFFAGDVLDAIAADGFWVAPDGTEVYGLYEVRRTDSEGIFTDDYFVEFGSWQGTPIPAPTSGSRILVRYNSKAPIRVFGGDATISPSVHAQFDRRYYRSDNNVTSDRSDVPVQGLPLPYAGFKFSPLYVRPNSSTDQLDADLIEKVVTIRQWCVAFDVETRTNPYMDLWPGNIESQAMPRGNYVIKPYDVADGLTNPGFSPRYVQDYGSAIQDNYYAYGGLRFHMSGQEFNRYYWKQPIVSFIGLPQTGWTDRTDYCNGLITSLERDPLQDNTPGLRTFLASNLKVISEENGEIKVIGSNLGPSGRNMYALTQSGLCRILTNKNILTGASGEQISTQSISNYWGEEQWLSRSIGAPDQMWRLMSKGYAPAGSGYADSWFWVDRNGAYRMTGDSIIDISRGKYLSQLKPYLESYPLGYEAMSSAVYDKSHNEAWISTGEFAGLPSQLFVYSAQTGEWVGLYSYAMDGLTSNGPDTYGHRDLETYILNSGAVISGDTRRSSVTVPVVGDVGILKELTRWAVTGSRPDEIEVLDKDYNVICRQSEAIAAATNPQEAQYWVLRYRNGWEQWAASVLESVDAARPRPQDELFYIRCTWFSEGSKHLVSLSGSMQNIK